MLESSDSTTELSIAVKGYSLLAGACRKFLTEVEVNLMLNQVIPFTKAMLENINCYHEFLP